LTETNYFNFFSGYIRAKIAISEGRYSDVIKECSQQIDAASGKLAEAGDKQEDDTSKTAFSGACVEANIERDVDVLVFCIESNSYTFSAFCRPFAFIYSGLPSP